MNKNSNPSIIARETFRQLATLKIPPTPDNYHKLYTEIEGSSAQRMSPSMTKMLSELAKEFPRNSPGLNSYANKLESSVSEKNWRKYKVVLGDLINIAAISIDAQSESNISTTKQPSISWGGMIASIMKQLEMPHGSLTTVKKRDGLNRVLSKFSTNPEQLYSKLSSLLDSWVALAATSKESVKIEVADTFISFSNDIQ